MSPYSSIERPTLLVDRERVAENIRTMAEKARLSGVRFRPHFKTHQSGDIAELFREEGVRHITVSSLSMAAYFAEYEWDDITVAFPVNLRESERIAELSEKLRLGLLVLDLRSVEALEKILRERVDIWIKVDTGYARTGIRWDRPEHIAELAARVDRSGLLNFRGLLTHAGQSYHIHELAERRALFTQTAQRLEEARSEVLKSGVANCELSVGDTPTATAVDRFEGVDEVRPGNFVYFDAQQLHIGSCSEDQIAAAVAAPVVALHPERGECVLYAGAVHLSAQAEPHPDGGRMYGYLVPLCEEIGETGCPSAWGTIDTQNYVRMVSQEHAVVKCSGQLLERLKPSDLVAVIPVHSCLAVDLLDSAVDVTGRTVPLGRF